MQQTCNNLSFSDFDNRLQRIDKRIRKLDNVKLQHVLCLENDFAELISMIRQIDRKIDEIKISIREIGSGASE